MNGSINRQGRNLLYDICDRFIQLISDLSGINGSHGAGTKKHSVHMSLATGSRK